MHGNWRLQHFGVGDRVKFRWLYGENTHLATVVKVVKNHFGRINYKIRFDMPVVRERSPHKGLKKNKRFSTFETVVACLEQLEPTNEPHQFIDIGANI